MRIAFVPAARLLSEREPNGEALIASALLRRLAARGHTPVAYCERADADIPGVDIREISADGPTTALGRVAFARRIARDVARERADVHHVLFPFTTADGYALTHGAPLVCGPVNLPWPAPRRSRPLHARATDMLENRYHRRTLARAARILVTGGSSARALRRYARATVNVPFGVDIERFAPQPLPEEPTIVFCAVLSERKGLRVLLESIPLIRQRVPRARIVVAGPDPDGLAAHVQASGARYAGAVTPASVAELFASATVVCQPSFGEPFGMTVIEAMACARAVVGTAAGGLPDAIANGRGGALVPQGDARLLADSLLRILEDRQTAQRMGEFNRARALETYSLDVVVERIEAVYADVAGRSRASVTAA
jgi:glycosyltransferase involved in cell wall biosynthesis